MTRPDESTATSFTTSPVPAFSVARPPLPKDVSRKPERVKRITAMTGSGSVVTPATVIRPDLSMAIEVARVKLANSTKMRPSSPNRRVERAVDVVPRQEQSPAGGKALGVPDDDDALVFLPLDVVGELALAEVGHRLLQHRRRQQRAPLQPLDATSSPGCHVTAAADAHSAVLPP